MYQLATAYLIQDQVKAVTKESTTRVSIVQYQLTPICQTAQCLIMIASFFNQVTPITFNLFYSLEIQIHPHENW